jgi:hypothetical protein
VDGVDSDVWTTTAAGRATPTRPAPTLSTGCVRQQIFGRIEASTMSEPAHHAGQGGAVLMVIAKAREGSV